MEPVTEVITETGTEFVNELTHLEDGTVQWLLDPKTYNQVSGMYAIGLASIVLLGATAGAYVVSRFMSSKEVASEETSE